ncbi:MAG: dihydrolipoyl dehydrogenase [Promethearchaeota archaeon]
MSFEEIFDLAIIGSGPGGYHAALRAAAYGAKVALIEKDERLGGTCSNWGCIPTKALYSSARMIADIKEKSDLLGIHIKGPIEYDFPTAVERKNKVVRELTDGIAQLCKIKKVQIFKGFGSLVEGNIYTNFTLNIRKDDDIAQEIRAKRVILATGSKPAAIPAFNIDHKRILDSNDILRADFKTVPKTLIIIGGGVIGCEFANIFAEFGSKVTILEYLPTILANEEKLVVKTLKKKFKHLGIEIHESKNVLSVEDTENCVRAVVCDAKIPREQIEQAEKQIVEADMCLVSIGREKYTEDLGLEKFQIKLQRGSIPINHETMETSFPGIYAIGDCTGILMLAHFASYQGDIAVMNALSSIGGFEGVYPQKADFNTVPATTFTHPNIGSVGLRQKEAKEKYGDILIGRFSYASSGKAKCMAEENGFLMVIVDAHTDHIVGASCIGESAAELISEISVAMRLGLTTHQLASVIHSHPTLSEIVLEAVEDTHGMAIHKAGKRH